MEYINFLQQQRKKLLLGCMLLAVCASLAFTQTVLPKQKARLLKHTPNITSMPTEAPSVEPTIETGNVLGITIVVSPTNKPTPILTLAPTNTPQPIQPTPTKSGPSTGPLPSQTPIPTNAPQAPAVTVSVVIQTPDASSNFTVELKENMNVCDVLQKAKDEGKIASLTLDDSYLASLNSKYVSEINGYKNNWTFKVNGSSPLGCSLIHPTPNDTIEWKFG